MAKCMKLNGSAPRPEGFRVITVGTGAPHFDPERASACTVVQYRDTSIIVDLGYRSVSRMLESGMDGLQIPNVLFTHCLHLDHTLDYGYFMCMGNGSDTPLNLYGPPGTERVHNSIYNLFEGQLMLSRRDGKPREVNIREIGDNDSFRIDDVLVTTKEVPHIVQDIAYRFDADGKRVVVPGDMNFCEAFIDFARDADLIVFDANTAPSAAMDEMAERMRAAGIAPDPARKPGGMAHASLEEIGEMAERMGR